MIAALVWMSAAWAGVHVVRDGETVESILEAAGAPERAAEVRALNGLPVGGQPKVSSVLDLPDDLAAADCQPSYVRSAEGPGTVLVPGGAAATPLVERIPLPIGSRVCTKDTGYATLRLALDVGAGDFDDVTLMPNTCLTIRGSYGRSGARTSLVQLDAGSVNVSEGSRPGNIAVQTLAGVTVGDDGGFRVTVEPDATRTEAVAADVVTLAAGAQVDVPEGFGGRTVVGEAPGQPIALLPPGALLAPESERALRRPEFRWTAVPVALGYRLEISVSEDFSRVVTVVDYGSPTYVFRSLMLPNETRQAWWRVSSIDRSGFVGVPSDARTFWMP